MVTPETLRLDAAKLDSLMEAFEQTYLKFLDIGEEEMEERNRGALAFYVMRDLAQKIILDAEELSNHIEVCSAIFATNAVAKKKREGQK